MCLCFPIVSPRYSWEQTIVVCSAKHRRHTVSFRGSFLGHSHERRGLRWNECNSQRTGLKMRYESLGSTHQGACKCLEKQKKVSSRTEMESAARVLQNECPYSAARELFLSRDSVRRGHNPFSHHERHRLFQLPEECGAGVWVSFKFIALSSLSAAPHNLGGGCIWLIDLSPVTFWKC